MKKPKRAVSSLGGMKNHPAEDFLPQAAARKHLGRKRPPAVAQLGPLVEKVRVLVQSARRAVAASFNSLQVLTNLEIGRLIVEHEQQGSQRADYGELVMGTLSTRLTAEFGRGFSKRNLEYWSTCASSMHSTAAASDRLRRSLLRNCGPRGFARRLLANWCQFPRRPLGTSPFPAQSVPNIGHTPCDQLKHAV